MKWILSSVLFLFTLSGCSGGGADTVFLNGVVWTAEDAMPFAEAVAVNGDQIVFVGSSEDARELAGSDTDVIDLRGRLLLPGFNDTHVHFASAARFLEFNIMRTGTQDEFVARTRDVMERLDEGEWILGGFWGAYDDWGEGSSGGEGRDRFTPDLSLVDSISTAYPMFIRRYDGSEFAANRAALELAGVDVADPDAPGVEFDTDAQGHATGIFRGEGVEALFEDIVPETFSRERRLAQTRHALKEAARYGVTSLSDMSDDLQVELYRDLKAAGELTTRVHYRYFLGRWREVSEMGISRGSGDEWLRFGALKGHIDGIMGTSTARFYEPYENDPGNYGRWRQLMVDERGQFQEGKFLGYMLRADSADLQLSIHAIGDEANGLLLDYLEELERTNGDRPRRFRLVHAQVIAPQDFARLGRLGVIAEVQPFHLSDDMRWMEERIGHERSRGAYAFSTLRENGAILAFGSDWPGTSAAEYPINPMLGLYAAVTRQTITGEPTGGWFPDERIPLDAALKAYTLNGAYSTYEEDIKGSILAGKLADLVVLDRNLFDVPPAEFLDTAVDLTMVGGRIVYRRP